MAIEFFSLFSGKVLQILHMLPAERDSYENMKATVQKAFGKSTEDARKAFANAKINSNETAVQAHARIVCFSDEKVEKEGIGMSYEALRKLFLRDRFRETCLPEFVATAKMQDMRESNLMAEKLDVHFSALGRKNMPETCHSIGSGESREVEVLPRVPPPKSNFNNYPKERKREIRPV